MSSARRRGFHSGPRAQSTLTIVLVVLTRNIDAAMIGLQLQPWPVTWGSSMLTAGTPRVSPHCANSMAAESSPPKLVGSPCGAAKLTLRMGNSITNSDEVGVAG